MRHRFGHRGAKSAHEHVPASSVGAGAVGAQAIGTMVLGAVALGALAIGALAIGRLAVGHARVRRLEIDELVVRKLRVIEQLQSPLDGSPGGTTSDRDGVDLPPFVDPPR